jgi:hypothetical protein
MGWHDAYMGTPAARLSRVLLTPQWVRNQPVAWSVGCGSEISAWERG